MAYPNDEHGRYLIPSKEGETRIEADCDCGGSWNVPERVWDWISDRHAWAHNKGRDGLPAGGRMGVRRIEPGKSGQPELEAAG
jgi:hypothetical protein